MTVELKKGKYHQVKKGIWELKRNSAVRKVREIVQHYQINKDLQYETIKKIKSKPYTGRKQSDKRLVSRIYNENTFRNTYHIFNSK